jgi:hypothetical protein
MFTQVSKEKNKGAKYRMRSELSALRKEVHLCSSQILFDTMYL